MGDQSQQLTEKEWMEQIRETAANDNSNGFRELLLTEIGQEKLEGFDLDPGNPEHVKSMMESMSRQVQEAQDFRRGVNSEGFQLNELESLALEWGMAPENLAKGMGHLESRG